MLHTEAQSERQSISETTKILKDSNIDLIRILTPRGTPNQGTQIASSIVKPNNPVKTNKNLSEVSTIDIDPNKLANNTTYASPITRTRSVPLPQNN